MRSFAASGGKLSSRISTRTLKGKMCCTSNTAVVQAKFLTILSENPARIYATLMYGLKRVDQLSLCGTANSAVEAAVSWIMERRYGMFSLSTVSPDLWYQG